MNRRKPSPNLLEIPHNLMRNRPKKKGVDETHNFYLNLPLRSQQAPKAEEDKKHAITQNTLASPSVLMVPLSVPFASAHAGSIFPIINPAFQCFNRVFPIAQAYLTTNQYLCKS